MPRSRTLSRPAFTLMELIVSIAIIAMLVSLLAPGLAGARSSARAVVCVNQLRTLGQLTSHYADDNRDLMPRSQHSAFAGGCRPWGYALFEYMAGAPYEASDASWEAVFNGTYRCPLDRRRERWSYGYNVYYELTRSETQGRTWTRRDLPPRPSATVLFGELTPTTTADHAMAHFWTQFGVTPEIDARRHGAATGIAYLDGHAASVPFDAVFDRDRGIDSFNPATAK